MMVARFAREKFFVEGLQRRINGRFGKQLHALAAARFDQRAGEQQVRQALGILAPNAPVQFAGIRARFLTLERNTSLFEQRQELLEMREFFFGEICQRRLEKNLIGVAEQQAQRAARGLFFAVRMVEQHLIEMRDSAVDPFGI